MHEIVIIVAKYFIFLSVLLALYVWLKLDMQDKKRFIIATIAGAIIALVIAKIGSKLFYNPRPFVVGHFTPYFSHAADNGFPSDHMLFASFLAALSIWYNRTLGIVLFVMAVAIGLSRVIAGIHHLIDITGSLVFGTIGAFAGNYIGEQALPYHKKSRFADKK